ncbi:uncharacterized protein N7496_003440 [Penicillium cataractarum]|uniref:Uncharacterized protein n=1 Tax=Penicillium cataractarum TaxID=2100454 RepID=A0A9W9VGD5_9EURO|nr:uncharacterized protein N7496_003440 [Penicillium cataractarum]KAJ5381012.1 hypothetical protein N7496_003440 [Penicillium cataractarum]
MTSGASRDSRTSVAIPTCRIDDLQARRKRLTDFQGLQEVSRGSIPSCYHRPSARSAGTLEVKCETDQEV